MDSNYSEEEHSHGEIVLLATSWPFPLRSHLGKKIDINSSSQNIEERRPVFLPYKYTEVVGMKFWECKNYSRKKGVSVSSFEKGDTINL